VLSANSVRSIVTTLPARTDADAQ